MERVRYEREATGDDAARNLDHGKEEVDREGGDEAGATRG